ncbi:uncharacterized protein LOC111189521 [Astyanax mexicanus]|uniref:uncharacterized protein LOC111189521 n=1 Tax=Astyanax mexicanus TaxID=7994 RepID=UPI0020CAC2C3|nr:uncharacterized protein LOC111189521 [Astyanax mexicanus]
MNESLSLSEHLLDLQSHHSNNGEIGDESDGDCSSILSRSASHFSHHAQSQEPSVTLQHNVHSPTLGAQAEMLPHCTLTQALPQSVPSTIPLMTHTGQPASFGGGQPLSFPPCMPIHQMYQPLMQNQQTFQPRPANQACAVYQTAMVSIAPTVYQPPSIPAVPAHQPVTPGITSQLYQPQSVGASYSAYPYSTVFTPQPVYQPNSTPLSQPSQLLYPSSFPQVHQPPHVPLAQPAYQAPAAPPASVTYQLAPPVRPVQSSSPNMFQHSATAPALSPAQPWTQPVPVPKLPKLEHDSEREFTDLKMALDCLLNPHPELTEYYKYRVLIEHLILDEARMIAQSCRHYAQPYTTAMQALQRQYGQPHQLAQSEIAAILNAPDVKAGDAKAFQSFALKVNLLVGMLTSLEGPRGLELTSTGHVDRLLSKLPKYLWDSFVEHLQVQGRLLTDSLNPYSLRDLAEWLTVKAEAQRLSSKMAQRYQTDKSEPKKDKQSTSRPRGQAVAIYHGSDKLNTASTQPIESAPPSIKQKPTKRLCLFCKSNEHYLSQCTNITSCTTEQVEAWITKGKRCRRCGRTSHGPEASTLKKACSECQESHLKVLHGIAQPSPGMYLVTPVERASLTPVNQTGKVFLKVVPVIIRYEGRSLQTHAILDDGAERTIILPAAVQHLGLKGKTESLALRTVRHDVAHLTGSSVNFSVSSLAKPNKQHLIRSAFTASRLALADQAYPVTALQKRYRHLRGIPIQPFDKAHPLLLIGADHTHLIAAKAPVTQGINGGPAAIHTELGWALQGPDGLPSHEGQPSTCYFTSLRPAPDDLYQHVERLWHLDVLPFRSEKLAVRSKQDQQAVDMLESHTTRVNIGGVLRYATPLIRAKGAPELKTTVDAVLPSLRSTERRLAKDPVKAQIYESEIQKLIDGGCVNRLNPEEVDQTSESWFIPHHLVQHNGKHRLVFNCSFSYQGLSLNEQLLPGPILGPSLIGVILRFRQYPVAISGDIKAMFHQVRLLPGDQPLLWFAWRNLRKEDAPDVYQWQVLPFGTTCSPCCAIFALQKHIRDHVDQEDTVKSIEQSFYVDNCLKSLPTTEEAKSLVDKICQVLAEGGFEIRQWASNDPEAINHLPSSARSESTELWLTEKHTDPQEPALGLSWHCITDQLGYKVRPLEPQLPTMRTIYRVLASQYDPLGVIIPYTTRAKVIVQRLWAKKRSWDDPNLPAELLEAWTTWENELPKLKDIVLPRSFAPPTQGTQVSEYTLHIFSDSSEQAYGSVAYLTTEHGGQVFTSFVMARSRVAPKRQLSMPRLELCAALTGAQLSALIHRELTLNITKTFLWSDSTTVLSWLKSESCRFKVFVGTRVSEIQELTQPHEWRYVNSANNPADDITRGKSLADLGPQSRWIKGPSFLHEPPEKWPQVPISSNLENSDELKQSAFCGLSTTNSATAIPDPTQFTTWSELVAATKQALYGAESDPASPPLDLHDVEKHILRTSQTDSFPEEVRLLKAHKPVSPSSRLSTLSPEWDAETGLVRVGGRLRHLENPDLSDIHPVVLDPQHPVTQLLIKDVDVRLLHPGPDRVFAELRCQYWILRGRQAVRHHQRTCIGCRRWRGRPTVPIMADLPPARLRLFKPPFYSTGVDCFGPYLVKVGRRQEKRWGVIFKCLTTRSVHLDLLNSLDADAFLLALRRFIARRGTPCEILSDQGTNFKGAETELKEAFSSMEPQLRKSLEERQISFRFNPPGSPHFGGIWEREIRSVKRALQVVVGAQVVSEDVLLTVLVEVEGILNSKPLGYVSSDIADPDPVTPNMLLMGRRDASLPQVCYALDSLTKRRWRHSQMMADHFWSQFTRNYLPSLQVRQKWQKACDNLAPDTVVMIVDSQLPRACWPIGKVVKLNVSADGNVRSAEIRVKDKVYMRPVARLVQLPSIQDDDPASAETSGTS